MLIRALIVLLAALNLGVAAWWWLRAPPPAPAAAELPAGVARLKLLHEAPPPVAPAAPPPQCFRFGPFASEPALAQARTLLEARARQVRVETTEAAPAAWRVLLPPQADAAAAQALAGRIGAAGFDDVVVIAAGEEANGIALGRYGSEAAARRRQQALRAAGFDAQLLPVGGGEPRRWLAAQLPPGSDAARLRGELRALELHTLDCATLR